jgi:hypothetical protein
MKQTRISIVILGISLSLFATAVHAFVPLVHSQLPGTPNRDSPHGWFASKDSSSVAGQTEAERLLQRARELRAEAEQAEQQVHDDLEMKKARKDTQTDQLIDQLFFTPPATGLVDRLRDKRVGMGTLEVIVDRLDEREVIAQGGDHVEFKMVGDKTEFHRVAEKDEKELERVQGLIDQLIQATSVLDKEFLAEKKARGESYVAYAEEEHWGGGKCAERLGSRIGEIRRERSEQFQKRMEEFNEAQRRKDDPDHKFKGYIDLGNLN